MFWVSKIALSEEREDAIRNSFDKQEVHFSYPQNVDDFNYLIESFMQSKSEYINSGMREEMAITPLIVMDDVSGLADKSNNFSNFLTVSRKYGFSCLYVFHTIYPTRQNWEMIMTQAHIFNFFPGSIHSRKILKTLSLYASRYKNSYVSSQNVWLNRLYFDISTSKEKQCLTIDTKPINNLEPGKFRTSADNSQEQTCYYNRGKSDTHFNSYFAKRRLTSQTFDIRFSIVKVAPGLNKLDVGDISLKTELKNIFNGRTQTRLQQTSGRDFSSGRSSTENKKRGRTEFSRDGRAETRSVRKKPRFLSG